MQIFEYTNKGAREYNQDFTLHRSIGNGGHIFIVADGMGGYAVGDIAAKSVSESIFEYVDEHIKEKSPEILLHEAVIFANSELEFRRFSYGGVQMGTVIVVMLLIGSNAYVTWLGDSRLYHYRGNKLCFLTTDHSMLNKLKRTRVLTPQDIDRFSAIVTQCIMGDDNLGNVPVHNFTLETGDVVFMCSDGIHKVIEPRSLPKDDDELMEFLNKNVEKFDDNYSLIKIVI
jgi:serine/threonine protein phosphatase PrpC